MHMLLHMHWSTSMESGSTIAFAYMYVTSIFSPFPSLSVFLLLEDMLWDIGFILRIF